jgi:hypothetical protein
MKIRTLIWDEWNIHHILRHQVIPDEVEEICLSRPLITRGKDGAYRIIGRTEASRYLTIIGKVKEEGFYTITARGSDDKEKKLIKRK